jgi:hypothetical protein
LYGFTKNTEITEKKVDVDEALQRFKKPIDGTKLTIEVFGVYGLPEGWKAKIEDQSEASYAYEIEAAGLKVANGKVIPRELTEEEKEVADAGKGGAKGGKPAGKDAKKDEPSPEEKERMEKEEEEKKEKERKAQEEWDALDEETKHLRKSEDIFKEHCIKMQNMLIINQIEALEKEIAEVPEEETEKKD